jgi:hypothetical protein
MNRLGLNPADNSAEIAKDEQQWAYVIVSEAKAISQPILSTFPQCAIYRQTLSGFDTRQCYLRICCYQHLLAIEQYNEDQTNGGLTLVMPRI